MHYITGKFFIDCGAHCGESIVRARSQFGSDIQIVSFEAVPELAKNLVELYEGDSYVNIINAAVWTDNSTIDINVCPSFTDGSSILTNLNNNHLATKVKVPCVDISSWIKNSFDSEDYLILKLDIEGAEYDVLEKLCLDGTISRINELWGEWHYGHIVPNLKEGSEEFNNFRDKVIRVNQLLKEANKELKIWEAYYTPGQKLTKRPETLTA